MKKILSTLLLSLSLFTAYPQKLNWIKFNWVGDSLGHRFFPKTAIDLPVKIENLPYKFSMQFDLGASSSIFYGNDIAPYIELHKELKNKIDTSEKTWIDSKQYSTFKDIKIRIDNVDFDKVNIGYYKGYGDSLTVDSVKTNTVKQIGTIGYDFFTDKILIIDYPNQRICVTDAIPSINAQNGNFMDCKFSDGAILIPFQIGDKTKYLMFDTGSSMFGLITWKDNAEDIVGKNTPVIDSICGHSWGELTCSYGVKMNSEVKFGKTAMPPVNLYYTNKPWGYFFTSHNIWGITGNVFFLNNVVVVDFKNQKIGVCKPVN